MRDMLRPNASVRRERTLLVGMRGRGKDGRAWHVRAEAASYDEAGSFTPEPHSAFDPRRADDDTIRDDMEELRHLAQTAGAHVVGEVILRHRAIDPKTFIGKGHVERVAGLVQAQDVDVVVMNTDLAPAQAHNLEERFQSKVIDRSELILDIFATRARTPMAKLQVELAQLEYILPRLRRMWTHLERQRAGLGTRGPGEQQLEEDRRAARRRILDLKQEIVHIQARRTREVARRRREFTVSLVGYTNAGKSTLMNALTRAGALVEDRLFSTLDTKTRQWRVDRDHRVLLSDTVGFIRHLPHHLVASFRATLEEARQASLLLHVADVSHPLALEHVDVVRQVLEEIGCANRPRLLVLNKIDAMRDDTALRVLMQREPATVAISARTGENLADLSAWVLARLAESEVAVDLTAPVAAGQLLSEIAAEGRILAREFVDSNVRLTVRIARGRLDRLAKRHPELAVSGGPPTEGAGDDDWGGDGAISE
jgi:GTP-binding protein HflX